jgi:hypothetical protein
MTCLADNECGLLMTGHSDGDDARARWVSNFLLTFTHVYSSACTVVERLGPPLSLISCLVIVYRRVRHRDRNFLLLSPYASPVDGKNKSASSSEREKRDAMWSIALRQR